MLNWVSLLIAIFLIFYLFDGYRRGVVSLTLELLGFFVAIFLAFRNYQPVGTWIASTFNLSTPFVNPTGFLAVWIVTEFCFYLGGLFLVVILPKEIKRSKIEHFLGLIPSLAKCFFLLAVVFSLIIALPVKGSMRQDILSNPISSNLVKRATFVESIAQETFGQSLSNTLSYLLSKPQDFGETVVLNFKTDQVKVDEASENKMIELVNKERAKEGLKPLVMDEKLREAARLHSKDMFAKGYFAHVNMAGEDPFERMKKLGITYSIAGENLAFAPNVDIAHIGLMNSPKHRDNILFQQFGHIGVGVFDAGIYGKMFSQEFTN